MYKTLSELKLVEMKYSVQAQSWQDVRSLLVKKRREVEMIEAESVREFIREFDDLMYSYDGNNASDFIATWSKKISIAPDAALNLEFGVADGAPAAAINGRLLKTSASISPFDKKLHPGLEAGCYALVGPTSAGKSSSFQLPEEFVRVSMSEPDATSLPESAIADALYCAFSASDYVVLDSLKGALTYGRSLSQGGISNEFYSLMSTLSAVMEALGKIMIVVINPLPVGRDQALYKRILRNLDGSCTGVIFAPHSADIRRHDVTWRYLTRHIDRVERVYGVARTRGDVNVGSGYIDSDDESGSAPKAAAVIIETASPVAVDNKQPEKDATLRVNFK